MRRLVGGFVPAVLLGALALLPGASCAQSVDQYSNSLAPTVGTPQKAIDRMLEMASLKPGETLYDLGCGDGRILIAAASQYKVKAVGIEISDHMARRAADKVRKGRAPEAGHDCPRRFHARRSEPCGRGYSVSGNYRECKPEARFRTFLAAEFARCFLRLSDPRVEVDQHLGDYGLHRRSRHLSVRSSRFAQEVIPVARRPRFK